MTDENGTQGLICRGSSLGIGTTFTHEPTAFREVELKSGGVALRCPECGTVAVRRDDTDLTDAEIR